MLGSETVIITGKKPRSSRKQAVIHQCFSPGFSSNLVTKTREKPVLPRNISTRVFTIFSNSVVPGNRNDANLRNGNKVDAVPVGTYTNPKNGSK